MEGGSLFSTTSPTFIICKLFNDTATTEIYTLSLHDALPISRVQSLGQEDPLEKEMATHSSPLAWRIPWMEEPGGLLEMFD